MYALIHASNVIFRALPEKVMHYHQYCIQPPLIRQASIANQCNSINWNLKNNILIFQKRNKITSKRSQGKESSKLETELLQQFSAAQVVQIHSDLKIFQNKMHIVLVLRDAQLYFD